MKLADIDFLRIPQGECVIGTPEEDMLAWSDEFPRHTVNIRYEYWLARFPVTNEQFDKFISETSFITQAEKQGWAFVFNVEKMIWEKVDGAGWRHPTGPEDSVADNIRHPVVSVSFVDALVYIGWLNQSFGMELPAGYSFGLPTEVEWEKAARGPENLLYPWGNQFDPDLCCWRESPHGIGTASVGGFSPAGDSHYGGADMAGNAWEWTTTRWGPEKDQPAFVYPYAPDDGREDQAAGRDDYRVIRGGSFKDDQRGVHAACRDIDPPNYALNNLGFRVFIAPDRLWFPFSS